MKALEMHSWWRVEKRVMMGGLGEDGLNRTVGRMGLGVEMGGEGSKMGSMKAGVEHALRVSIIVTLTPELRGEMKATRTRVTSPLVPKSGATSIL